MDFVEEDKTLGKIVFRQNGRITRYAIKVVRGQVIVQYPLNGSQTIARRFLEEHRAWVEKIMKEKSLKAPWVIDENSEIFTQTFRLKILRNKEDRYYGRMEKDGGLFVIFCPESEDINTADSQTKIKRILLNALTIEAKKHLPGRLKELAEQHGFSYRDCQIRKMRSRWGSCSTSGSIHLSSLLMALPQELSDFVMLHELCHTLEMNHGPRFYHHLDAVTDGQTQTLEKQLKLYGRQPMLSTLLA